MREKRCKKVEENTKISIFSSQQNRSFLSIHYLYRRRIERKGGGINRHVQHWHKQQHVRIQILEAVPCSENISIFSF